MRANPALRTSVSTSCHSRWCCACSRNSRPGNWRAWLWLWPLEPFAAALGLLALYALGPHAGELLLAAAIIGGISLVENYRGTFNTEIQKSGVDGLIKTLREKNRSLVAQNK